MRCDRLLTIAGMVIVLAMLLLSPYPCCAQSATLARPLRSDEQPRDATTLLADRIADFQQVSQAQVRVRPLVPPPLRTESPTPIASPLPSQLIELEPVQAAETIVELGSTPDRSLPFAMDFPTVPESLGPAFPADSQLAPIALDPNRPLGFPSGLSDDALVWWADEVSRPLRAANSNMAVDVIGLMSMAAQYSGRVLAVQHEPWIQSTYFQQASAAFDPTLYSDKRFNSTSDPVGNSLITGGPPRLQEYKWTSDAGVRGQTQSGASYNVGQQLGHLNSNSTFVVPNNQGTARLTASLTQPLLRNRSIDLNRSLILTTRFETDAAQAEYYETLQLQLNEVAIVYWSLYTERGNYVLRMKHLERAQEITQELEDRASFDMVQSQVIRAKAAVAVRTADLIRSDANIKNFESRLRALLNAPNFSDQPMTELVTGQAPWVAPLQFHVGEELATALNRRPEVQQILSRIQAAGIRVQLATNQTLPKLNMVLESYVAGLKGNSDVFGALGDQFSESRPGYAGGLEFEMPYRNRVAQSRLTQRRLEVSQLENQLREVQANVQADVENAIRNVEANYQATQGRKQSLRAVIAEVAYLQDRWVTLRGDPQFGQLQLEDLLNSQVRLLQEEQALMTSMVDYHRSLVEVQRSTGALVRFSR